MATAYVSFHTVAARYPAQDAILSKAIYSEALTVGASPQATASALTSAMAKARDMVAFVTADVNCWLAIGPAPDTSATVATTVTSARQFVAAGTPLPVAIEIGDRLAVQAVS